LPACSSWPAWCSPLPRANSGALVAGGDVIVAIDQDTIAGPDELAAAIRSKDPDSTIDLTYVRGSGRHTVAIALTSRPG
jgi:S1-C subfamily serine protease